MTGTMQLDTRVSWGFAGEAKAGSALQVSTTPFNDHYSFTGSSERTGYMLHVRSGLCLTMTPPAVDSPSSLGRYHGGKVVLQECGSTATPPPNQNFELTLTNACCTPSSSSRIRDTRRRGRRDPIQKRLRRRTMDMPFGSLFDRSSHHEQA